MADRKLKMIQVRAEDHEAAKRETKVWPVSLLTMVAAWRVLWESSSEAQKLKAVRRVRQPEKKPEPVLT